MSTILSRVTVKLLSDFYSNRVLKSKSLQEAENLMSTSVETQHPKINHKCNTHEIVFTHLNNKASKIDHVIMLETSFVQRHNASCKNGIQKLKITTVDLSLRR